MRHLVIICRLCLIAHSIFGIFAIKLFCMKIYVAGKISGEDFDSVSNTFACVSKMILTGGNTPINPIDLNKNQDKSWEEFLQVDLSALLLEADAICVIFDKFGESLGTLAEISVAIMARKPIFVYKNGCISVADDSDVADMLRSVSYQIAKYPVYPENKHAIYGRTCDDICL